jgi:hypothetical protein
MFAIRIEIYVFAVLQTTFQTKFIWRNKNCRHTNKQFSLGLLCMNLN